MKVGEGFPDIMRIVLLGNASDTHVVRWVNELSKKKHEVHLISCKNHSGDVDKISFSVRKYVLPFKKGFGYYLNAPFLSRIVNRISPDISNVHYASGYGTLARISRLKNTVLSIWGADVYDFPLQSNFHKRLVQKNLDYAEAIASTSLVMAKRVKDSFKINKEIVITPFGVDVSLFKMKKTYNKGNIIKVGIVKKMEVKYGVKNLIESFSLLVNDNSLKKYNINLEIIGTGSQLNNLKALAESLQIDDKVTFLGRIPNDKIIDYIHTWDVFAVSSIMDSESFGVVAVEAMAAGLPVVATDVDGFKEVVEEDKTGIIVKRNNPRALYHGIKRLIIDSSLRERFGVNGRKRVENQYIFSNNVDTMIELYKTTARKKRGKL